MNMISRTIIQVILFLGYSLYLHAQDTLPFSTPPTITGIEKYSLNNGLASTDLNEVFIDRRGRIWVNPNVITARQFRLSFFQFDGTQSIFYDLKPEWLSEESKTPTWFILGETQQGFLYGSNRLHNILFYWHPDTQERYFFPLEDEGKLLNMVSDTEGGVLVLTVQVADERNLSLETYKVFRLFEGSKSQVGSIQLDFKDDFLPISPKRFTYPFEVTDDQAWFFHQRKGLVKLDLKTGSLDFTPWADFRNISSIKKSRYDVPNISFEWKMIGVEKDKLFLFLGHQNGFYTLRSHDNHLEHNFRLNNLILRENKAGDMLKVFFTRDKKSNLFITSGYFKPYTFPFNVKDYQALMIDHTGDWYDYTGIVQEMNNVAGMDYHPHGQYFSSNFQYELGSTVMEEGMAIMDLQPDLKIDTFNPDLGYGMRSITSLDSKTLLVNTEVQIMILSLADGSWKRLLGRDVIVNGLSKFISQNGKVWISKNLEDSAELISYNPVNNQIEYFPVDLEFEKFVFLNDKEIALFQDRGEFQIVGQIYIYNLDSKTKRSFMYNDMPFSIGDKVNDLLLLEDSILLVGAQNGLWQIDFLKNEIKHINRHDQLKDVNIICIHQDEDERLWLGTGKSGILIYNPESKNIKQISKAQGLSNNRVVSILPDDKMIKWAATLNGITVLDTAGNILFTLKQSDGLANDHFNRTSNYKLSDGKLVFGGISGVSVLDPKFIRNTFAQVDTTKIYLTKIEYYNKEEGRTVVHQGSIDQNIPIQIPANHRYINLDFAISKYVNLKEHTYEYRFLPREFADNSSSSIPWTNLGSNSSVTINNLPTGNYFVQVRGIDHRSIPGTEQLKIEINVHEYFYRTWWFYLSLAITLILIAWIWIRRINTEKIRLELEVDRRTDQIQKDKATIEQQAKQLKELDLAKSRFFTNISHEFRTPLTVVLGTVEQIKDNERIRKIIKRNAEQLLELVNQILELRKLESTNIFTKPIQGDMVAYLKYIIESFHSFALNKEILIKFETEHQQFVVDYDPDKLLRIVSNLLVNALKFTPAGGEVKVSLEIIRITDAPYYQISVSDTGLGIPSEKLSKIFDRFYQVDDEVSRTGSGTGIGLALVKELVNVLGGEISVESRLKKGTTFKIKLPITNQAEMEIEMPEMYVSSSITSENIPATQNSLTLVGNSDLPSLLIVEDNPDVMQYLITCLNAEYKLLFALDGHEGIQKALEKVPDIIISDVMMPEVNGFELCNTLKTDVRTSHIPIVLLTAKSDLDSRITGLQRGADAYLVKPFDKIELLEQLQNLLNLRQKLRDRYTNPKNFSPTEDVAIRMEDEFITRIREVILENVAKEDFGVHELCKKAGMSRTQLHNKIKSLTDRSTTYFIRQVRVEKACQLFLESELNVSQIAFEVGIENLSYFSRIFKSETGISPNQYREKYKSERKPSA